eukprot:4745035-Amphidinium_carterae.1
MRYNAASAPLPEANDGHLRVHRTGEFSQIAWHGSPQSTVSVPHMYTCHGVTIKKVLQCLRFQGVKRTWVTPGHIAHLKIKAQSYQFRSWV